LRAFKRGVSPSFFFLPPLLAGEGDIGGEVPDAGGTKPPFLPCPSPISAVFGGQARTDTGLGHGPSGTADDLLAVLVDDDPGRRFAL
jgi:hypothetical protein